MQALYTAEATAVGGRQGHVRSSDGVIDLDPGPTQGARWRGRRSQQPRAATST